MVDTGLHSNLGQRLRAVEPYLDESDDVFMANYSDGLTDLHLPTYLDYFRCHDATASFLCVRPTHSFHVVQADDTGLVQDVRTANDSGVWINGGYFILKRAIFKMLGAGDELVEAPFRRLIDRIIDHPAECIDGVRGLSLGGSEKGACEIKASRVPPADVARGGGGKVRFGV